jgi:di/tricarboxylate transporter
MAFSSGELRAGEMVRPGLLITLLALLLTFSAGYLWWGLVGLF